MDSAARSSRVRAPRRHANGLARVASLEEAPRFVLVSPGGDEVALDYGTHYELRAAATGAPTGKGRKLANAPLLVWKTSVLADFQEQDFAGHILPVMVRVSATDGDKVWALHVGSAAAGYVVQQVGQTVPSGVALPDGGTARVYNTTTEKLLVEIARFTNPERTLSTPEGTIYVDGRGCGAIAEDGRIAVATADQRFLVFDASHVDPNGSLLPIVTARLTFVPTDISVIESGVAVLSGSQGRTALHVIDWQGSEQWKADLPFDVSSPPIDGGGGRIYLTGRGFAAVEQGRIVWSQGAPAGASATSLADGTVLLAAGVSLRVVGRDGTILESHSVPEGDPIVAAPAVAEDGSVWVATAKALYAAR